MSLSIPKFLLFHYLLLLFIHIRLLTILVVHSIVPRRVFCKDEVFGSFVFFCRILRTCSGPTCTASGLRGTLNVTCLYLELLTNRLKVACDDASIAASGCADSDLKCHCTRYSTIYQNVIPCVEQRSNCTNPVQSLLSTTPRWQPELLWNKS